MAESAMRGELSYPRRYWGEKDLNKRQFCLVVCFCVAASASGSCAAAEWIQHTSKGAEQRAVLLLIPGYNGSWEAMTGERWKAFAEKHGLY